MKTAIALILVVAFFATLASCQSGCHWTGCHSKQHASACPADLVAQNEDPSGCKGDHVKWLCCQPGKGGNPGPKPQPNLQPYPQPAPKPYPQPAPQPYPLPVPDQGPKQSTCQDYTYQQCVSHCNQLRG